MLHVRVSPSDFGFLYRDCPRCTWLKLRHGVRLPERPFPSVFIQIDSAMKNLLSGPGFMELLGYPGYEVANLEDKLESAPIVFEEFGVSITIGGKPDKVFKRQGEDRFLVFENKTSTPSTDNIVLYRNQQTAYAYCIENPKEGAAHQVSEIALCCFDPQWMSRAKELEGPGEVQASLRGCITVHKETPDYDRLHKLLFGIAELVSRDTAPAPPTKFIKGVHRIQCGNCRYLLETLALDPLTVQGVLAAMPLVMVEAPTKEEVRAEVKQEPVLVGGGGIPRVVHRRK